MTAPTIATVVLGDGTTATIRPIEPTDAAALRAFHRRQSPDSTYRRFFTPKPDLTPAELERFTTVDFADRAALVVEVHGEFVAWASYERWPGRDDAESAFMVDDDYHGRGVATLLLEHLAAHAATQGIVRFTAEVLPDNRGMLNVFARAGWPLARRFDSGVIEVDFPIAETVEFLDTVDRREQRADSRAMARLLLPRSIAVVGASDTPGSVGTELWRNVTAAATGPVYAVNPRHESIGEAPCWPSVADVPDDVSLAVVAVPAASLAAVLDDCAAAGVRGAVVITVTDGTDVDVAALVERSNRNGMRVIGPASFGVASSRADVGLNATLIGEPLPRGPVALSLQSGSLAASVLRRLADVGLGVSWFVSLGDRSDVSGNDLLQFWEDDGDTTAIGMYTETLGNPRRFARIARRVSQRRPIVAVRTGAAATGPATGALYRKCGLIEVPTVSALVDTLRLLASQPVPRGKRIAVVSNSRSPATLAHAALRTAGLEPVPAATSLDWSATADDVAAAAGAALADPAVDGLLIIHAPPLRSAASPAAALDTALAGAAKPAAVVLLGSPDGPVVAGSAIPAYAFPEAAAAALGRAYAYGHWLDTEAPAAPVTLDDVDDVDDGTVERLISDLLVADDATPLTLPVAAVATVLAAYGITMPSVREVAAADAADAADALGYPVALKAERRHPGRSIDAGVALDVADRADVEHVVARMRAAIGDDAARLAVQRMAAPGVDLRVRMVADERIGPLIDVGLGGQQAGYADTSSGPPRLAPLSVESASALVTDSPAAVALHAAGLGTGDVLDVVVRVGLLAATHPEIASIDLNPVIVNDHGAVVTDAAIRLAPTPTPPPRRQL